MESTIEAISSNKKAFINKKKSEVKITSIYTSARNN